MQAGLYHHHSDGKSGYHTNDGKQGVHHHVSHISDAKSGDHINDGKQGFTIASVIASHAITLVMASWGSTSDQPWQVRLPHK